MKIKKLRLEDFASSELSRNQKLTVLGKGDTTASPLDTTTTNIILTSPTTPPGGGMGNGDARKAN